MTRVLSSQTVTASDQGAVIKVVLPFCTTMAVNFFVDGLYVPWPWWKLFGKDDCTVVFSNSRHIRTLIGTPTVAHMARSAASLSSS